MKVITVCNDGGLATVDFFFDERPGGFDSGFFDIRAGG